LTGTDLLRELRDHGVDTPCLLLSAYASAEIRQTTFRLGNVVRIVKGRNGASARGRTGCQLWLSFR
jgi:hypothetical protein